MCCANASYRPSSLLLHEFDVRYFHRDRAAFQQASKPRAPGEYVDEFGYSFLWLGVKVQSTSCDEARRLFEELVVV